MEVRLAEHYGMCFGVKDALALALDVAGREPVTILGDLVHNDDVVATLEAAGAVRARRPEEVKTQTVVLTAHGTAQRIRSCNCVPKVESCMMPPVRWSRGSHGRGQTDRGRQASRCRRPGRTCGSPWDRR